MFSCALVVNVDGETCIFIVHFRSKTHLKFVNGLNTPHQNLQQFRKMTGKNVILHIALVAGVTLQDKTEFLVIQVVIAFCYNLTTSYWVSGLSGRLVIMT